MNASSDIIVLCAGGHARVLVDILRRRGQAVAAMVDNDPSLHGKRIHDIEVIGSDEIVLGRDPKSVRLVNALGNVPRVGDSALVPRRRLYETFKEKGYKFIQVCSADAVVSKDVDLGEGCQIVTGAIIHTDSLIGANTIINTGAQLDHDCRIGAHSHIAPGAVLSGCVVVGNECHIGAGAVIVQGVSIGDGALVGAGALVLNDVPSGTTVLGNPARRVRP